MVTKWILVFFYFAAPVRTVVVEFDTRMACEVARVELSQIVGRHGVAGGRSEEEQTEISMHDSRCLKKG